MAESRCVWVGDKGKDCCLTSWKDDLRWNLGLDTRLSMRNGYLGKKEGEACEQRLGNV
jgi:hypothetical protein